MIGRSIDPRRVIACIVYPATSVMAPGIVRHLEGERFSLGELDGSRTERIAALSGVLNGAGFKAPVQPRIRQELWVKLMGNAVFNPLSAITRASLGAMDESPVRAPAVRAAMEEVDMVAARQDRDSGIDRSAHPRRRAGGRHKTSMLRTSGRPRWRSTRSRARWWACGPAWRAGPHLETIYAVKVWPLERAGEALQQSVTARRRPPPCGDGDHRRPLDLRRRGMAGHRPAGRLRPAWAVWRCLAPVFLATWVVMMVAMMFPSIAPMVLAHARIVRSRGEGTLPTVSFVLATWPCGRPRGCSLAIVSSSDLRSHPR